MQTSATRKRLALAIGTGFSLAGLSASAVAPLATPLSPNGRIIQSIELQARPMQTEGTFQSRFTHIRPGERLIDALERLGDVDAALLAFIQKNPHARRAAQARPGHAIRADVDAQGRVSSLLMAWPEEPRKTEPQKTASDQRATSHRPVRGTNGATAATPHPAAPAARDTAVDGTDSPVTLAGCRGGMDTGACTDTNADRRPSPNPAAFADLSRLQITRTDRGWAADRIRAHRRRDIEARNLTVVTSIAQAASDQGVPDAIVARLPLALAGNVDPAAQSATGNAVRVLYEIERDPEGLSPDLPGRLLAAQFDGQIIGGRNRQLRSVWFEHADGDGRFYAMDGSALATRFLETPVAYTRVSSPYLPHRRSPVDGVVRAHMGVDYAAPQGAPVMAVADGTIEFIGTQNGFGNVIIVRHDDAHHSLYAHLSDFARKLKQGSPVRKGQPIGAVGATGWATGPHLHFEMHVKGEPVDPGTVIPPRFRPIEASERHQFQRWAERTAVALGMGTEQMVAAFE